MGTLDAIIIARGGSLRLHRKNIKVICGHPLVAWSIRQAVSSRYIDNTYVSTDDDEIAKISQEYGAKVIRRPKKISYNDATAGIAFYHAYCEIEKDHDITDFMSILPTSPLRFPYEMDEAIKLYKNLKIYNLGVMAVPREVTVCQITGKHRGKIIFFDKRYNYGMYAGGFSIANVRKAKEVYEKEIAENGNFARDIERETCNTKTIKQYSNGPDTYFYETNPYSIIDIDDQETFEITEALMNSCLLKGRGIEIYDEYKRNWEMFNEPQYTGNANSR